MRLSKAFCVASLLGLGIAASASADSVTFTGDLVSVGSTFIATGGFGDGASLGGTLIINTGNGVVSSNGVDLTVTGGQAGSPGLTFDTLQGSSEIADIDVNNDNIWDISLSDSQDNIASLTLEIFLGQGTSLAGFTGPQVSGIGALCNTGGNCGVYDSNYATNRDPYLTGGQLSEAPEPASLLLFAAPAFVLFRRSRRA